MRPGPGFERPADNPRQSRSVVMARRGMVATSQPLAVQAGLQVLQQGGTAADAAIAASAGCPGCTTVREAWSASTTAMPSASVAATCSSAMRFLAARTSLLLNAAVPAETESPARPLPRPQPCRWHQWLQWCCWRGSWWWRGWWRGCLNPLQPAFGV